MLIAVGKQLDIYIAGFIGQIILFGLDEKAIYVDVPVAAASMIGIPMSCRLSSPCIYMVPSTMVEVTQAG